MSLASNNAEPSSSRVLLKGKTEDDFLRLVKGKISRLELRIEAGRFGGLDPATTAEEIALRKAFDEPVEGSPHTRDGWSMHLLVDDKPLINGPVDLGELIKSTYCSGERFIFTCTCGVAECAGFWTGVVVATDGKLTVWKAYGLRPRRVFVFDRNQYQNEIIGKMTEVLELVRKRPRDSAPGPKDYCPLVSDDVRNLEALENALAAAERSISRLDE